MRRQMHPPTQEKGFTAIEIAMVASVIAILALLILPLFRNRAEDAKLAAAHDELQSLAKALILVKADTGHYFRLQDLDNGTLTTDNPDAGVPFVWSGVNAGNPNIPWVTLTAAERLRLISTASNPSLAIGTSGWRGPYISFQKSIPFGTLHAQAVAQGLALFTDIDPLAPIYVREDGGDHADDRIPIDPWGSPYLFINLSETSYGGHNYLYSTGPNGLPGDGTPPYLYYSVHTGGKLGTGDDIEYTF